jgi:type II secretory pathway component PulM
MMRWWRGLALGERRILGVGVALALLMTIYALAWRPFSGALQALREGVVSQRADLARMRQAADEIKRLEAAVSRRTPAPSRGDSGAPLLTVVDQTTRQAGLSRSVKRIEPRDGDKVSVRLELVRFDKLVDWLGRLQRDHGIAVDNAVIDRRDATGFVNARFVLERPSA